MIRALVVGIWLLVGWWELQQQGILGITLPNGLPMPGRLPVPTRVLPVPILFWTGWLVYAWVSARRSGCSFRTGLARTLWGALAAQGLLLVADLHHVMQHDAVTFLERGYFAYYLAALGALLVGLGVAAGWQWRGHAIRQQLDQGLPIYGAATVLYGSLAMTRSWWALGATGMGLILAWAWSRWPQIHVAWPRVRRWVRSPQGIAVLIGLAALAVRLAYGARLVLATGDQFVVAGDDSRTNDLYAWALAQDLGGIMTIDPRVVYPPGYWMFLGMIYRLFGHQFGPAVAIQACASAMVPVCVYWLTRRLFPTAAGEWAARLAGVLAVLNTALIHVSITLDQEAVYLPLLCGGLCALLRASGESTRRASTRWFVVAGVLFGFANFMRPITLYISVVVLLWLWGLRRKLWLALRETAWFTIPMILVLLPLIVRNGLISGEFMLTGEAAGHYRVAGNEAFLALGIHPFEDLPGTLRAIAAQPLAALQTFWAVVPARVMVFFFIPFFGTFDPVLILNAGTFATAYALQLELYAYLAMGIGLWWGLRQTVSRHGTLLLVWVTAYFSLTPVLWFVRNATYRVPLHPIFLVWLATGVVALRSWSRNK